MEARELNEAEIKLIKSVQDELKKQDNFKQLVSEPGVKEQREILSCMGTLVNSDLDFDARRPIILPKKHHLMKLIIPSPAISVTTIQHDVHEVDFTAALPLVSTGSYHRDARYIICCLYEEV